MDRKPKDADVLAVFVDEMEALGMNRQLVRLTVDAEFAERLSVKLKVPIALDFVKQLTDRCLANEWLEHTSLGAGQYAMLRITTTGFGVVRSTQRSEELKSSRSAIKKLSDVIEEHKGLFIAIGAIAALATVVAKLHFE
jgi:hypothetical protein